MDNEISTIFIGSKPLYSYINACLTQLSDEAGGNPEIKKVDRVVLKARGRAITRAVDVAEVLRKKSMVGKVEIEKIEISTEVLETRDGRTSNVSAIEITINKISHMNEPETKE